MALKKVSIRIDEATLPVVDEWAKRLGISQSEWIRDAIDAHLDAMVGKYDVHAAHEARMEELAQAAQLQAEMMRDVLTSQRRTERCLQRMAKCAEEAAAEEERAMRRGGAK